MDPLVTEVKIQEKPAEEPKIAEEKKEDKKNENNLLNSKNILIAVVVIAVIAFVAWYFLVASANPVAEYKYVIEAEGKGSFVSNYKEVNVGIEEMIDKPIILIYTQLSATDDLNEKNQAQLKIIPTAFSQGKIVLSLIEDTRKGYTCAFGTLDPENLARPEEKSKEDCMKVLDQYRADDSSIIISMLAVNDEQKKNIVEIKKNEIIIMPRVAGYSKIATRLITEKMFGNVDILSSQVNKEIEEKLF